MNVALTGHEGPVGAALAAALEKEGTEVACIDAAALASRELAAKALEAVTEKHGAIQALVHAHVPEAALSGGPFAALSDAEWDARGEAPVRATINLLQAGYPLLRETGGVIVTVVPTIGLAGQKQFAAYAAACEAQRCLMRSTARAWGRRKIRAHTLAATPELFGGELGALTLEMSTLSPLSLRGRDAVMQFASLASTLHFLLSDAASGLTGTTTAVDSGRWMAP